MSKNSKKKWRKSANFEEKMKTQPTVYLEETKGSTSKNLKKKLAEKLKKGT